MHMRKILLLIVLVSTATFLLNKERPEWFLIGLTWMPIINTELNIDFSEDQSELSEANIHSRFGNLFLVCGNERSNLGDRVCWTYISRFNGLDAKIVAFFFDKEEYRHLRVSFPDAEHNNLLSYLNARFKLKVVSRGSEEMFGQELGVWFCKTGTLSAYKEKPKQGNKNLLLWSDYYTHSKEE